ncbi:MAG: hypothetical protein N2053_05945 [Chitinispirillaceae bacterium]|nr:hypothetical protein [Chitinispirillaceae bacterium]
MDYSLKSSKGASLIEICIAAFVISVAAVMIVAFSKNTLSMSAETRGNDAAYLAGEQKISQLSTILYPPTTGKDTVYIDSIRCIREWTIKDTAYIKRVVVKVTWQSLKGPKQITIGGAI